MSVGARLGCTLAGWRSPWCNQEWSGRRSAGLVPVLQTRFLGAKAWHLHAKYDRPEPVDKDFWSVRIRPLREPCRAVLRDGTLRLLKEFAGFIAIYFDRIIIRESLPRSCHAKYFVAVETALRLANCSRVRHHNDDLVFWRADSGMKRFHARLIGQSWVTTPRKLDQDSLSRRSIASPRTAARPAIHICAYNAFMVPFQSSSRYWCCLRTRRASLAAV